MQNKQKKNEPFLYIHEFVSYRTYIHFIIYMTMCMIQGLWVENVKMYLLAIHRQFMDEFHTQSSHLFTETHAVVVTIWLNGSRLEKCYFCQYYDRVIVASLH